MNKPINNLLILILATLSLLANARGSEPEVLTIEFHQEKFGPYQPVTVDDPRRGQEGRVLEIRANDNNALSFCRSKGFETVREYRYKETEERDETPSPPPAPYTRFSIPAYVDILPNGKTHEFWPVKKGTKYISSITCISEVIKSPLPPQRHDSI